jgi:alanine dehydrogenase
MRFFTEADVRHLLPMPDAIRCVRDAFTALGRQEAQNQPRRRLILPTGAVLHSLAGAFGNYFGTKIYSTHRQYGAHFLFVLYDAAMAKPLALFEANYLGQIRTGAASGVATDLLARRDMQTVGLIGAGFQARSQLEAMLAIRPVRQAFAYSRTPETRERFVRECSEAFHLPVQAVSSARDAVTDADIVITATSAGQPVFQSEWVRPGTHINAVGSNIANRRELPGEILGRAALVAVDSMEQAMLEAGDLLLAGEHFHWHSPKLTELADLAAGTRAFARQDGDITVFKSVGLGIEDVAVAALVYERARAGNVGGTLPLFYS